MSKKKRVFLVGTCHRFQRPECDGAREFQKFVEESCRKFGVRAISEEMNFEALEEYGSTESICSIVARTRGIPHQFNDPNRAQREELGIKQLNEVEAIGFLKNWDHERTQLEAKAMFSKREGFWVDQIKELDTWPTLFICGADHVRSFEMHLKANGIDVNSVISDWRPKIFCSPTPARGRA